MPAMVCSCHTQPCRSCTAGAAAGCRRNLVRDHCSNGGRLYLAVWIRPDVLSGGRCVASWGLTGSHTRCSLQGRPEKQQLALAVCRMPLKLCVMTCAVDVQPNGGDGYQEVDSVYGSGSESSSESGSESSQASTGLAAKLVSCLSIMRASSAGEEELHRGTPRAHHHHHQGARGHRLPAGCTFAVSTCAATNVLVGIQPAIQWVFFLQDCEVIQGILEVGWGPC